MVMLVGSAQGSIGVMEVDMPSENRIGGEAGVTKSLPISALLSNPSLAFSASGGARHAAKQTSGGGWQAIPVVLGSFAIGARSHEPEAVWADAAAVAGIVVMDFTTGPCRRLFAFGGVATPPPGARGARLRHIIEDRDATGKMREYMRDS